MGALCTLTEIKKHLGTYGKKDTDADNLLKELADAVTSVFETICNRTFEAADYIEYYNGKNNNIIVLNQYPINSITRVVIGRQNGMYVYNTDTYTTAFVSVTSTGLVLTKDGTSDSTVTFASYTTLSDIVTAVNAIDTWAAVISSSDFNNYQSTELLPRFPSNALDSNYVYLEIPDEAESIYEVDADAGIITLENKIAAGIKNIRVEYNAGYNTIPDDLNRIAIQEVLRLEAAKGRIDETSTSTPDGSSITYMTKDIFPLTKTILSKYKKHIVV